MAELSMREQAELERASLPKLEYDPSDTEHFKTVPRDCGGEIIDIVFRKGKPGMTVEEVQEARARGEMVNDMSICPKNNPRTYIANKVPPYIICEQDVVCPLRDGTKIYADIYRPADVTHPVPLIISWGTFGKRPHEGQDEWKLMGVPPGTVSDMAKFEAADPAYWCRHGYAVANVDPRGVGNSEGDIASWGHEDARDGYDFVEWAAVQSWCNGRVTFFGNSGVAMVIWRIAAMQPPHLSCIAVWEATGDMYRESITNGGITRTCFEEMILNSLACKSWMEDMVSMLKLHPYMDKYWETKIPDWSKIRMPAYICAGLCHFHLRGSFEGWRRIRSPKKWLRVHRDMEWPDTYNNENLEDLRKFYDRYLKDLHNGWEMTPKVRMDVMDAYEYDAAVRRPEKAFPLKRTQYTKLYLDAANNALSETPVATVSEVEYDGKTGTASFGIKFQEDTELIGYMKLHTFIECRGHDNMDMFLWVKKYKADGTYVPVSCMGEDYRGAWGYFSGKRRELDPKWSTDFQPVQAHWKDEPMEPGKVYEVDIEIYPHSRLWHKGEELRLEITGEFIKTDWYEDGHLDFVTDNGTGRHVIHTGGQYESYLQIPVIPPKYQSGDFIVR